MDNAHALLLKALELQGAGNHDQAESLFLDVIRKDPGNVAALYSLGVISVQVRHRPEVALGYLERARASDPSFVMAWNASGSVLQSLGRYDEAGKCYKQATNLDPRYAEAWMNSGILLHTLDKHVDALLCFEKVREIEPDSPRMLANRGILLTQLKQGEQAIASFKRLLEVDPGYAEAPGMLLYEQLHACDWSDFERLRQQIVDGVRAGKRMCSTLALMSMVDSASDHFLCAKTYAKTLQDKPFPILWQGERYDHSRIRIGYLSPDLREHPVGQLMIGVIERHDKTRFETFGFSLGIDDKSTLRERYLAGFEHFHDVRSQTAEQIARLIRANEIDVLIDLAGYTSDSRSAVLLHRPAPIQVNYLGYPGTLALPCMDYIIADRHIIPEENKRCFAEQVVYLPYTYLPTDAGLKASPSTPPRTEYGLPEQGLVFCAFNHDHKINPRIFDVWMNILGKVPDSVLWLMARNDAIKNNLRREAKSRGIDPARLVFAGRVPEKANHLARYRLADLFLDATPYNAHTTAADALQGGLPVITYRGSAFPGRVASGLLAAAGLPQLAVDSFDAYVELAVDLALDEGKRKALREHLVGNRDQLPLFDTPRFCRDLESAFATMWQRHQQGLPVESFAVDPATPSRMAAIPPSSSPRRLKIEGEKPAPGWQNLSDTPADGADHAGDVRDLSRFSDGQFELVYTCHSLNHLSLLEILPVLKELARIIQPGGRLMISVPDLEVLCRLFGSPHLGVNERFHVMRMIFGGQTNESDFNRIGLNHEFLQHYLLAAGFRSVNRVDGFGQFDDASELKPFGVPISLNLTASK